MVNFRKVVSMDILKLIFSTGLIVMFVGDSNNSTTTSTTTTASPVPIAWNVARFSDLMADIVASCREGCRLGKRLPKRMHHGTSRAWLDSYSLFQDIDLKQRIITSCLDPIKHIEQLRARLLKPKWLQKLIRRKVREGKLIILNATLHSSSVENSFNTNLLSDFSGIQKYMKLLNIVRKHTRMGRRQLSRMWNKLLTLTTQFRQVLVYRGEPAVTIPGSQADVNGALGLRQKMDEVEKCINDYAVIREIGKFLNRMRILYPIYNKYAQDIASTKKVCF